MHVVHLCQKNAIGNFLNYLQYKKHNNVGKEHKYCWTNYILFINLRRTIIATNITPSVPY